MPLWRIFHPDNYFTASEKDTLARDITALYTPKLPAFYVGVLFIPMPPSSTYVGGEQSTNYVRFVAEHIARNFDGDRERMDGMMRRISAAVGPLMKDKGAQWEVHVAQTEFDLWSIQGVKPPRPGSEGELVWKKENRVVPY